MEYYRVVRTGRRNSRVLLPNGDLVLISNSELTKYSQVDRYSPDGVGKLTCGVEFEFLGLKDEDSIYIFNKYMKKEVDPNYNYSGCYGKSSKRRWVLGTDGSVRCGTINPELFRPYELTTDAFRLDSDYRTKITRAVNGVRCFLDGRVNDTCGLHVHIGSLGLMDSELMRNMLQSYSKLEPVIDTYVSEDRNSNAYCKSCKLCGLTSKYFKLSFHKYNVTGTVEFRHHQSTLDIDEILLWIEFCSKFAYAGIHNCISCTDEVSFLNSIDFSQEKANELKFKSRS